MADRPNLLGPGPSFGERLTRWAADARADEALVRRDREAWLRQAAGESSSLVGVLLDLAEGGRSVLVVTRSGRRHRGGLEVVGADFVALRTEAALVLVASAGLAAVHADSVAAGNREELGPTFGLAEALALLAEDRPPVLVVTAAEGVSGELRWCGTDVLAVGDAYVPLAAVLEVVVAG